MFTSVIKYLISAALTAVFGLLYEHFSHGVVSYRMVLAFLFPLLGGTGLWLLSRPAVPDRTSRSVYACGILTLTVGSILSGILEIYGTTNRLCRFYWFAGIGLTLLGSILCTVRRQKS